MDRMTVSKARQEITDILIALERDLGIRVIGLGVASVDTSTATDEVKKFIKFVEISVEPAQSWSE